MVPSPQGIVKMSLSARVVEAVTNGQAAALAGAIMATTLAGSRFQDFRSELAHCPTACPVFRLDSRFRTPVTGVTDFSEKGAAVVEWKSKIVFIDTREWTLQLVVRVRRLGFNSFRYSGQS